MKMKIVMLLSIFLITNSLFAISSNSPTINLLNDINYATTNVTIAKSEDMLVLNDIYEKILNNYDPQRIDQDINQTVVSLANNIEGLRLINIKKDRLDVIFDYQKSMALVSAVPSPVNLIGSIALFAVNPVQAVAGLVGTAASSAVMYKSAVDQLNLEMIEKEWELDDLERSRLNSLNINSFSETAKFANKNSIDKEYIMTIQILTDFINIINDDNIKRKVEALEYSEKRFKYFPTYWLELAQAYYDNDEYQKVIDTVNYYENHFQYDEIFKQNYRYAQILTLFVTSILKENPGEASLRYKSKILEKLKIIEDNTDSEDWLQKYFCAITYLSFAEIDDSCFIKAYDLFRQNCITLSLEQENSIDTYLAPVAIPNESELNKMTKEDRKKEEKYFKKIKRERAIELPPINRAYMLNINTLASLMRVSNKINFDLSFIEDSIITPFFKDYYLGTDTYLEKINIEKDPKSLNIFNKFSVRLTTKNLFKLTIPAMYINNLSKFEVKFSGDNKYHELYLNSNYENNMENLTNIKVTEVKRSNPEDINSFLAILEFEYETEWLNNADLIELDIRITTNDCPIVFHCEGATFDDLINTFSYIEKNAEGFF